MEQTIRRAGPWTWIGLFLALFGTSIIIAATSGWQKSDVLAAHFPVSRPAVSKQLRKLKSAGLVSFEATGRSHVYRANLDALGEARAWIESMWALRLQTLKRLAEGVS